MNAQLRRRLEMAGRVREFLRAHKTDGVGEGLGLAKLEELLTRAEVLASQQRSGVVARRGRPPSAARTCGVRSRANCCSICGQWVW